MTGLSGILGGTLGTVRLQKIWKQKVSVLAALIHSFCYNVCWEEFAGVTRVAVISIL